MNRLIWPCAGLALLNFALCFLGLNYLRERDEARASEAALLALIYRQTIIVTNCERSFVSPETPQYTELVAEPGWCLRVKNAEGNWDRARGLTYKGKPILIYSDERNAWVRP
jgi:hypothetical protein